MANKFGFAGYFDRITIQWIGSFSRQGAYRESKVIGSYQEALGGFLEMPRIWRISNLLETLDHKQFIA